MKAEDTCSLFRDLETARNPWLLAWQENARYCQPRRHFDLTHQGTSAAQSMPELGVSSELFDSTGGQALMTGAAGFFSWTSPKTKPWFKFAPPIELQSSEAARMKLDQATDITRREYQKSNFYSKIFELQLDRWCFGTACQGKFRKQGKFHFTTERDFVCCEGEDEKIDIIIPRRTYSHRQAVRIFGADNLPGAIAKKAVDPKQWNEVAQYIHACYPNPDYDPRSIQAKHFQVISQWCLLDEGKEVSLGYAHNNPYAVSRFLTWSGMDPKAPYGWSPAFMAIPDLRQLNRLEMLQDAFVDIAMNPRVLVPADLVGRVDFRPKGVTVIPDGGGKPEEWLTEARGDIGEMRAELKRQRINDAFMLDLFKMFAQLDKANMTAAEIYARLGERLDRATPSFDVYHTDLLEPMNEWAFETLAREGAYGTFNSFPREMMRDGALPMPEVEFLSRIAIETQSAEEQAALQALVEVLPLNEFDPEVAMQFRLPEIARRYFTGKGAKGDLLKTQSEIKREMAAMQRQMMMQQQEMQEAA
jgi:hypothetical protein